jgi:EAL domain-containing protein (putative c-di-GMP-specific phosphodiesterase class I)
MVPAERDFEGHSYRMSAAPLRRLELATGREAFPAPFTMAFQPIVDAGSRDVFAYEALVRGVEGEPAAEVLSLVDKANRHDFDQQCRMTALECAARLGLKDAPAALSINFMPNAVVDAAVCTRLALKAAERLKFSPSRIIFEFTEGEPVDDPEHLGRIIAAYRAAGFRTAIDDFGAGYSGLTLLARFQPDIVKLDMELVRGIDSDRVRRSIVASIRRMCDELGIVLVAEGIETLGEYAVLRDLGVSLLQGFLFARPAIDSLPVPAWPRGR